MRARLLANLLKRRVLAALVVVVAVLGATAMYVQAGKITTTYRTSPVVYGTITQTIGMAGNLAPVTEADLNFAASGTVQTVYATVGETVVKRDELAAQDSTLLAAQLSQAEANLSSAEAKLTQDEAGPTSQNLAQAENPVSQAEVSVNSATTSLADTKAINAQSVAAAQSVVDQDNLNVAADCPALPACSQDQAKLATDQETLAAVKVKAQQSNDQAAAQLASAKQQLAAAKSSLSATLSSTTPQTIQIDAAQVQIAQVNVNTAKHQLAGAVLISPIDGIVSQVNIQAGQTATGGGTTYAIVVYSPGAYQLTGTVSDAQVNLVAAGETVQVTPAGSTQALLGKVTAISPAATITGGVATFGVTAQLSDTSNSIKPGISATASIVVKQVVHVLTVPTSAVHTTAAGNTVQILVNGSPQSVAVQVGASDPLRTEILSGLSLNQQVVIAVVTSSVPSSGAGTVLGGGGTRGGGGTFPRGGG
ncbi:MAG TPA: HlyD family efflux transporter periplasmic adaptor subunit [Candidatus Micrarchaeaceae archaeon]|nr:HlyD family efflux transporter periplasmic adaptor subunit [Candidatus Micrarchaeaceae archaeon]